MISVLNSTMPLQYQLRAATADGTTELRGIAAAAHYLQDEFASGVDSRVEWWCAAGALQAAASDASQIPNATRVLRNFLIAEGRFLT